MRRTRWDSDRYEWEDDGRRCIIFPAKDAGTKIAPSHKDYHYRFRSDEVPAQEILALADELEEMTRQRDKALDDREAFRLRVADLEKELHRACPAPNNCPRCGAFLEV